jgi:hypothetical protein
VILVGSVQLVLNLRRQRKEKSVTFAVPRIEPYGRSAFDTPPDPAARERGNSEEDGTPGPHS